MQVYIGLWTIKYAVRWRRSRRTEKSRWTRQGVASDHSCRKTSGPSSKDASFAGMIANFAGVENKGFRKMPSARWPWPKAQADGQMPDNAAPRSLSETSECYGLSLRGISLTPGRGFWSFYVEPLENYCRIFNLTPAPPPFSAMNSIPAT